MCCSPAYFSYPPQAQYTSIFSVGDSYTDAGNKGIISGPATPDLWITKPPYGMTFFGHPTGRLSDGRRIIDFIGRFTLFFAVPTGLC
jgi:hypothetical protein